MALSDSLAALNTHRCKTQSLQLIKTALAVSQYKRSDRSVQISATLDVGLGGVMGKTERLTNRRVKTASGSTQRCRREMKTLIAPGEEMKWSENTPHGNPPSLPAGCTGSRLPVCPSGEWERISVPVVERRVRVFSIALMRQAGS